MRMMMKVQMDTEAAARAVADGSLAQLIGKVWSLEPEAAYFGPDHGIRTAFIVFDLKDPSQLPPITEPLFAKLHANIQIFPVMNREDLQKGLSQLGDGASPGT